MLNILSLSGPSRCGKGAIIPIIAAIENFELPYNTPDLDWYVDAYNTGDISIETLCRISANYLLCYSWYGYLGRHINLRSDDYYSLQKMMPHINLDEKHQRLDKDNVFKEFLLKNDAEKFWNIFQWDIPPELYEIYERDCPINANPIYCYRSPYYLFTSWLSSNRIKRSLSLSRMFKYDSTFYLKRDDLFPQFESAVNDNEHAFNEKLGTYEWYDPNLDGRKINSDEEHRLISLIDENNKNANYWQSRDKLVWFEHLVSDPKTFIDYLKNRFEVEFDQDRLIQGITLMNQRPIEDVIEMDLKKITHSLEKLRCSDQTIKFIVSEQKVYLDKL